MDGIKIILVLLAVSFLIDRVVKAVKKKATIKAAALEKERRLEEARRRIEEEKARDAALAAESAKKHAAVEAAIQKSLDAHPGAKSLRREEIETEVTSSLLNITEFTPISKKRYVAFDLETTGLSNADDAIVEIGAVRVENGQITAEYQQLIDPERHMPAEASAVNHITDDMLQGMPKIYEALPAFLEFVGDDVLVAHNARFDARFIAQACMRHRFATPARYFDTMALARYWPESPNKKLSSLIAAAGVENDAAHRALGDARALAALISATNKKRFSK